MGRHAIHPAVAPLLAPEKCAAIEALAQREFADGEAHPARARPRPGSGSGPDGLPAFLQPGYRWVPSAPRRPRRTGIPG